MDEMEFDKTRKAIKAGDLDNRDRSEMVKKLRGAGGEVLTERSVHDTPVGGGAGGGSGSRGGGAGSGPKLPSEIARERMRNESEAMAKARRAKQEAEAEATSFFARFSIKLKCRMSGLTPFGRDMVTPRMMSRLNLDAKRAVMECNILAKDLFSANPAIGNRLIKELDKRQPAYVELIERAAALYSPAELSDLTSPYNAAPTALVPLDAIRAPLFSFLRKLYYLKTFQETYLVAVDMAIGIQQQLEKKQAGLYASKRKKIANDWKTLMNDIYPSLVLLAQRAEMKKAEPGTRLFHEMLDIVDEDRIGSRKAGDSVGAQTPEPKPEQKAEESQEQNTEEEAEEEVEQTPAEMELGLQLMRGTTVAALRQKHDPRGELKGLLDKDKVFLSYLFLKEFESEYSFILTTQKIKLNPIYAHGKKIDYHQQLADTFEQSRSCFDGFKQYAHQTAEYQKVAGEGQAVQNYVEHAKRVQLLEGRRGASGRETRVQIKGFMEKVHGLLAQLLEDMKEAHKVVSNPEEVIRFDSQIEGKRRLNGHTVRDCIAEAHSFSLALCERIDSGDLFGGVIEMSDADFAAAFGQAQTASEVPDIQ